MAVSDRDRSFGLSSGEGLAAGLSRVAAGRAECALDCLRGSAGQVAGAEAVHGARKDLKKLRTVLRLLREELGGKRYRRANGHFREAGRALSTARDAEVKQQTLEALAGHEEDLPAEAVESWRKILVRDREAAANTARDRPAVEGAAARIEQGLQEIRGWDLEGDAWDLVGPGLTRAYRRGRRAMKNAERRRGEGELHEWRKRSKDLWYGLRLLSGAWSGPLEATAEEAHELSDRLGDHHDLAVLREDLAERNLGERETAALEAASGRRQEELANAALALGRRLYAERPQDFNRRLRRYWEAWRG